MTEPWKKYQTNQAEAPADGPWAKYAPAAPVNKYKQAVESQRGALSREGQLGARYWLEGSSTPVAILGNAANGLANLGISGVNAVAGTNIPKFESYEQYTKRALDKALPSPETANERVIGDMSRFVSGVGGGKAAAEVGELMGTKSLAPMAENLGGQALAAEMGGGAYGIAGEHTDNPWLKMAAAMLGTVAGGGVATAAEHLLPSNAAPKPTVPTTQEIKSLSSAAYKDAEAAGAIIKPEAIQRVSGQFTDDLAKFGYDPALQPKVAVLLDRLSKAGENNITAEGIDVIRKIAGNVARDGNPSERAIAGQLIGQLDDMMDNLTPADVLQGNAEEAASAFTRARDLWKTFRKSELIDNLVMKGEDQALSTNSGGNVQNAIRQKLRSILDNPKTSRLFSKEEQDAIRQIVRGTATQNALRTVGRLAPSSNSWLGPILATMGGGAGYAAGGIPGVAAAVGIPAVGAAAKAGATSLTNRAVNALSNQVRSAALPRVGPVAPQEIDLPALFAQSLMQGTRPQPLSAYADALLRSGPVAVPASDNPGTGPRIRP